MLYISNNSFSIKFLESYVAQWLLKKKLFYVCIKSWTFYHFWVNVQQKTGSLPIQFYRKQFNQILQKEISSKKGGELL